MQGGDVYRRETPAYSRCCGEKELKWHLLRLLRLKGRDLDDLLQGLDAMYLGYREVSASLVETAVHDLIERGLVRQAEILEITDRGREAMHTLAEQPAAEFPIAARRFLNPRLIKWYAEAL